jgi:transcription initiation factor TFIIIB Brf1 subunit/transcription initiation factor TFIIB
MVFIKPTGELCPICELKMTLLEHEGQKHLDEYVCTNCGYRISKNQFRIKPREKVLLTLKNNEKWLTASAILQLYQK